MSSICSMANLDGECPGVCGQRTHAKRRLTDCAALNYQDNGRLVAPAWQCAGTHEQGVFPASRLRRIGAR